MLSDATENDNILIIYLHHVQVITSEILAKKFITLTNHKNKEKTLEKKPK